MMLMWMLLELLMLLLKAAAVGVGLTAGISLVLKRLAK